MKDQFMKESVMRSARLRSAALGGVEGRMLELSAHFEGLANPTRLKIVERLASGAQVRVSELADHCKVSQPRMSWHLRILRRAGVIDAHREGREVFCRLDRDTIATRLESFRRLLTRQGAAEAAESHPAVEAVQPVSGGAS